MSISVYLATEKENKPFIIYFRQLFLNALWTIAFFGFDLKLLGFIIIVALIILVIRMIREFYKQNKLSAYLLIPYLLWLIFAGYLNLAIYLLNR
jgi:tryptophan-rich sensory protein